MEKMLSERTPWKISNSQPLLKKIECDHNRPEQMTGILCIEYHLAQELTDV